VNDSTRLESEAEANATCAEAAPVTVQALETVAVGVAVCTISHTPKHSCTLTTKYVALNLLLCLLRFSNF